MHTANDIANWFLAWAEHQDADISNLKLQKLLYYAQGHYIGRHGDPLFGDDIQAWAHGPVVPAIYRRMKQFGAAPIDPYEQLPSTFSWDDFRDVEFDLVGVWNTYGDISAWKLRERTHAETPWLQAFNEASPSAVISHDSMATFFAV